MGEYGRERRGAGIWEAATWSVRTAVAASSVRARRAARGLSRRASAGLAAALVVGAALLGALGPAEARAAELGGSYDGIDEASGWKLKLTQRTAEGDVAAGFDGVFTGRDGRETVFQAYLSGEGGREAETRVQIGERSVFMRFSPRPIGLVAVWIPVTDDGVLVLEKTRSYPFVRAGVKLPEIPEQLARPPKSPQESVDPLLFLVSYEFWRPNEVGNGYAGLDDRWRTLIRLYAEVHTDVLWKLCQARRTPPGLGRALEGQNVTCADVLKKVAAMQQTGKFNAYKADLAKQKLRLIDAVKCARGQLLKRACIRANAWTQRATLSLDTAATVLARY